ncbi:Biotin--protein ligase [Eumeta japonica]|uniref:Biotin--protein ligase n=1 Tax=Eumeta variegata TaxID=151549 RepID=A0A4C1XEQ5_EUMVA|nr:Biotin--protein ligase [Eumeta japonica]
MKPNQCIDLHDWVSCAGGLPLGSTGLTPIQEFDLSILLECEMEPSEESCDYNIALLDSMGEPVAWKAGSHLAIVLKTNVESLSVVGFNFVGGEFIIDHKLPVVRIQKLLSDMDYCRNQYEQSLLQIEALQEKLHIDKINMDKLLHELELCRVNETVRDLRHYGVTGWALDLLKLYLSNKVHRVGVNGMRSSRSVVDMGGPQGSVLAVQLSGEPNKATDASMRCLRSEILQGLKSTAGHFQWPPHAALLRKLSKVVDIKSEVRTTTAEMNGSSDNILETSNVGRRNVSLADVSVNTTSSLTRDDTIDNVEEPCKEMPIDQNLQKTPENTPKESQLLQKTPEKKKKELEKPTEEKKLVISNDNVTVEIKHNITPKKSSLKLDLKKGTSQLSASLLNISSQIKSVTTHKRIVTTTGPKKCQPSIEGPSTSKEEPQQDCQSQQCTPKSAKCSRPLINTKSPNVLIYSDSVVARDNLEASLKKILDCNKYTIYSISKDTLEAGAWRGRAALVAVAGDVVSRAASLLLAHLLDGGRLLALCSNLLHTVLPYYKTAEVRENEIVQFTYDKWKSVKMKHHIFCYQASPAKKQFSTESDRQPSKYTGHPGHELDIQVLASEETWRTPSLLQATDMTNSGVAIFSQVHLEADPSDYLGEEGVKINEVRLEIVHKILGSVLGLHVCDNWESSEVEYTRGFFLGNHVHKMSLVEGWCAGAPERVQNLNNFTIQWCGRGENPAEPPSANYLPVFVLECPENFSTVEYFDNLTSSSIGRLVIYSEVLESTQTLITTRKWAHGLAVVARRQTGGKGRGGNKWLSNEECARRSLKYPVAHSTRSHRHARPLGQCHDAPGRCDAQFGKPWFKVWLQMSPTVPLVQHAAALAAVRAVRSDPAYEDLDLRIKWPNDIYYGREVKIGGVITNAHVEGDSVCVNIGTGLNISNSAPTTCVNDIVAKYNAVHGGALSPMSVERFLARYCSQLERILQYITSEGGVDAFLEQYYQYWLHDSEEVRVLRSGESVPITGVISGIDSAGQLRVRTDAGDTVLTPDGNTFDMMTGLIAPKL